MRGLRGDIEAEFAEFSRQAGGKASSVDAVEIIGPKVGVGDASPRETEVEPAEASEPSQRPLYDLAVATAFARADPPAVKTA